jgi:hypothetical protein
MFEFLLGNHMPDRALIRYRAGLLDENSCQMLEAHLLLCPTCQIQAGALPPLTAASGIPQLYAGYRSEALRRRACCVRQAVETLAAAHRVERGATGCISSTQ